VTNTLTYLPPIYGHNERDINIIKLSNMYQIILYQMFDFFSYSQHHLFPWQRAPVVHLALEHRDASTRAERRRCQLAKQLIVVRSVQGTSARSERRQSDTTDRRWSKFLPKALDCKLAMQCKPAAVHRQADDQDFWDVCHLRLQWFQHHQDVWWLTTYHTYMQLLYELELRSVVVGTRYQSHYVLYLLHLTLVS